MPPQWDTLSVAPPGSPSSWDPVSSPSSLPLQFQMTFHLFIAAFVGAAATLVSLVSQCSPCPAVLLRLAKMWGKRTAKVVGMDGTEPVLVSFSGT